MDTVTLRGDSMPADPDLTETPLLEPPKHLSTTPRATKAPRHPFPALRGHPARAAERRAAPRTAAAVLQLLPQAPARQWRPRWPEGRWPRYRHSHSAVPTHTLIFRKSIS